MAQAQYNAKLGGAIGRLQQGFRTTQRLKAALVLETKLTPSEAMARLEEIIQEKQEEATSEDGCCCRRRERFSLYAFFREIKKDSVIDPDTRTYALKIFFHSMYD